jgi:aspartyl-tRNA(Asn)/glutamyl-tRNA(Gln) amidotransferase subunit C
MGTGYHNASGIIGRWRGGPVAITRDEVRHIAKLANLDFTEEEFDRFTRQLNAILEHVAHLNTLDTAAIEPTFHVGGGSHALRDDVAGGSIPREEALANAPEAAGGLFKVPKVIG